jgi:hypothetical protein
MKKTATVSSHISVLLVAFLALSSIALAQNTRQPAGQGDQSKLVQIVRNATKQTLCVSRFW